MIENDAFENIYALGEEIGMMKHLELKETEMDRKYVRNDRQSKGQVRAAATGSPPQKTNTCGGDVTKEAERT